jgi:hypothetical protein
MSNSGDQFELVCLGANIAAVVGLRSAVPFPRCQCNECAALRQSLYALERTERELDAELARVRSQTPTVKP